MVGYLPRKFKQTYLGFLSEFLFKLLELSGTYYGGERLVFHDVLKSCIICDGGKLGISRQLCKRWAFCQFQP